MEAIDELKQILRGIAEDFSRRGPGFAQEPVVLREAADRLRIHNNLEYEQRVLDAWHQLFRDGALHWGYNIDNPGQPFFHLPEN